MKTRLLNFKKLNPLRFFRISILTMLALFYVNSTYSQTTVWDIIINSSDHNTLEAALRAAELEGPLWNHSSNLTVFAPTDDAFDALPAGTVDALLADPTGTLTDILLYHIVGAEAFSTDLSDGQMITTLNGDSVTVKFMDGAVYIDNAMVTVADLEADNGVVHVIDAVILPKYTVLDIIVASDNHNTLEAAVIAAELDGALSGDGPFTVFAPTDDAFAALPAGTVDALLADPTGDLAQILLYHVVGAKALSTDLSDGQMITTLNGDSVTVKFMDGAVYIDNAMVTVADLEADNGVVHVIDAVILPSTTGIKERIAEVGNVSVYPNPAREFVNIKYEIVNSSNVSLEMYNLSGRLVASEDHGYAYEGSYTTELPVQNLEPGMYILILNTGNSQVANKVRVVK